MKRAPAALVLLPILCTTAWADPPQDLRAELPRDVRIVILGVPSTEPTRDAADSVHAGVQQLEQELAAETKQPTKIDQAKNRLYFRLGQLDETLRPLAKSLHDQERVKGLESYRDLARAVELQSQALTALSGTSEAPLIQEDEDAPPPARGPANPAELVAQTKSQLALLSDLLDEIESAVRPDAERKAQLEREIGSLGQFVFQIKSLAHDIRAAETGTQTIRVDTGEIVRSVQGLIDAIREAKREKELRLPPNRPR